MALISQYLVLLAFCMLSVYPTARAATATYIQSRAAYYPNSDEAGTDGNPTTWTPFLAYDFFMAWITHVERISIFP